MSDGESGKITKGEAILYWENVDDKYIIIGSLYVPPISRRKGEARKLMGKALFILKNKELPIRLVVKPGDDTIDEKSLIKFYTSFGFAIIIYNPEIIMEKEFKS